MSEDPAPDNVLSLESARAAAASLGRKEGESDRVTLSRAHYERIEAGLLDNVAELGRLHRENTRLRRALRAAEDARDDADARLLALAQEFADAIAFQRNVEAALARNGSYQGGEA